MTSKKSGGYLSFIPALALCAFGMFSALLLATSPDALEKAENQAPLDRMVAAVFPPWWSAERVMEAAIAAGVPVVRAGGIDTIVITASPDLRTDGHLRDAGALFLLDPLSAAGCLTLPNPRAAPA